VQRHSVHCPWHQPARDTSLHRYMNVTPATCSSSCVFHHRRQIPVCPVFAMSINKAQGQTLQKVRLIKNNSLHYTMKTKDNPRQTSALPSAVIDSYVIWLFHTTRVLRPDREPCSDVPSHICARPTSCNTISYFISVLLTVRSHQVYCILTCFLSGFVLPVSILYCFWYYLKLSF